MKKLTAGIFTVLLGVVAANSADAALTSKAYVDTQVGTKVSTTDFNQFKTENTTAIADAKKAGTDANAALESYKTTNDAAVATKADSETVTAELAKKQNTLTAADFVKDGTGNVVTAVTVGDDGKIKYSTASVATSEELGNLQTTVAGHTTTLGTLTGDGDGSIAKSIADAITNETTRANAAYATADQGKKADSALQKTGTLTAGNLLTTDASGNIIDAGKKGALAALDTVDKANLSEGVQASLDKADSALQEAALNDYAKTADVAATYETITNSNAIKDTADANKAAIATLNGTGDGSVSKAVADAKTELTTAIDKKQNTLTAADVTVSGDGNVITGITAADGKITATMGTTLGALATAAPGECSEATKFCALTFNGTTYKWEVIERVDGE